MDTLRCYWDMFYTPTVYFSREYFASYFWSGCAMIFCAAQGKTLLMPLARSQKPMPGSDINGVFSCGHCERYNSSACSHFSGCLLRDSLPDPFPR